VAETRIRERRSVSGRGAAEAAAAGGHLRVLALTVSASPIGPFRACALRARIDRHEQQSAA
jgi:hypothetical protein